MNINTLIISTNCYLLQMPETQSEGGLFTDRSQLTKCNNVDGKGFHVFCVYLQMIAPTQNHIISPHKAHHVGIQHSQLAGGYEMGLCA